MSRESVVLLVLLSLTMQMSPLLAEGKAARITLRSGLVVEGELLAVRDSSLLISSLVGATKDQLRSSNRLIVEVATPAVKSVAIKGEGGSHAFTGALVGGAIAGAGVAIVILSQPERDENTFAGRLSKSLEPAFATMLVLGGIAAGTLFGSMTRSDMVLESSSMDPNFKRLKAFARYPFDEPEFLRSCVPRRVREQ